MQIHHKNLSLLLVIKLLLKVMIIIIFFYVKIKTKNSMHVKCVKTSDTDHRYNFTQAAGVYSL